MRDRIKALDEAFKCVNYAIIDFILIRVLFFIDLIR